MLKKFNQRGQVLVFYALMVPLLFLFIGAVADLGWYYLNKSRLQNAADAAVLAGAQAIVTNEGDFENYFVVSLAKDSLPADFDDYRDVFKNTFDSTTINTGTRFNYKKETDILKTLNTGRYWAETYMRKNLEDDKEVTTSPNNVYVISATDGWNASSNDSEKKVSGTLGLKYKIVDGKNDVYGPLYYVVNLQEKVRHFLLPNWFDPMNAEVTAVALLRPHHIGLITPIQQLERTQVIDNWEYANAYKGTSGAYNGNWGHYQAGVKGGNNYGIRYTSGNAYRQESVIVKATAKATDGKSVTKSSEGTSLKTTNANNNWVFDVNKVDSINIDFRAEVKGKFSSDWDLGYAFPESGHSYQFTNDNSWSATDGANKRILFNVEFDEAFAAREDVIRNHPNPNDNRNADPLWVRIESDPLKNPYNGAGVSNFNSVRQITLNFNFDKFDNTSVKSDADGDYYEYRPYFIFYDGPENIDNKKDANGVLIRHSQPVVINLNNNLNAIIYMPESPVIINGNGNTWHGFIIAKCFLKAMTSEDMTGSGFVWQWDGFNAKKKFTCGFTELTDGYGNTIYVRDADLLSIEDVRSDNSDYKETIDSDTGTISFYEEFEVPETPVLSFTKDIYTDCTTIDQYLSKTADYITQNYTVEKYMAFRGITDSSQISMIKFPNEKDPTYNHYGHLTGFEIPVATDDLSDEDLDPDAAAKDDRYVKVLLIDGTPDGTPKYINKSKLPHIRVIRNSNSPYVCLYDLRTGLGKKRKDVDKKDLFTSVKPTDDNATVVFYNSGNEYKDTWIIDKTLLEKTYDTQYKVDKLQFSEREGVKFFMFKADILAPQVISKYRKINISEDEVKYVEEGANLYFTKVKNNAHNENNYIIVDEYGNILTKPVTAPEVFNVKTKDDYDDMDTSESPLSEYWEEYTRKPKDPEEIPGDRGTVNSAGKYVGNSSYRVNQDYRIPALERIYKMSTFDLSEESCYSYFDIESLHRTNYTYMNVDEFNHTVNGFTVEDNPVIDTKKLWKVEDMFFTTTRAEWID